MPILAPPITNAPDDTVEQALNLARTRVNDAIVSVGGEVITDALPATVVIVNGAWRRLQSALMSLGAPRLKNEKILYGLPVVSFYAPLTAPDPGATFWINWSQCFDGANYWTPPSVAVLPADLIVPLKLWERPSGGNTPTGKLFMEMDEYRNGLPRIGKQYRNWYWEWKDDTLTLPGATLKTDILIRYAEFIPDFTDVDGVPWHQALVPIPRAQNAFALYIASEIAGARGDVDRAQFDTDALAATMELAGLPPPTPSTPEGKVKQ